MTDTPLLFCFGLGYTARALAGGLRAQGWRVAGTRRGGGAARRPSPAGADLHILDRGHIFDRGRPLEDAGRAALARATHVLSSVPPDGEGDPVLDHHRDDIARAAPGLAWVGYLSTTAVYGDRDGGWVDEDSEIAPTGERGHRRAAAERAWLALWRRRGVPVHVFRLAGIYGPGRSVLDQLRAGRAKRIDTPGHSFSRVHVDDIVATLRASMARPDPGAAYNVCDDRPAPQRQVVEFAARLIGVEPPPLVPLAAAELSPLARSFYADDKRVRNGRIKRDLGVELRYPDYEAGLEAIRAADAG